MCLQAPADVAERVVFFRSGPEPESHREGCEERWRFSACDDGEGRVRRSCSVLDQGEGLWMLPMEEKKCFLGFFFLTLQMWNHRCNVCSFNAPVLSCCS